jgi:valyl-tRNA synthetase
MAKLRLYEGTLEEAEGARWALYHVLLTVLKLLAPILPYVTEEIYRHLFAPLEADLVPAPEWATTRVAPVEPSIHLSGWPMPDVALEDEWIESVGEALIEAVTAVRRYKTEHNLALSAELAQLQLATPDAKLVETLRGGLADIKSITRAKQIEIGAQQDTRLQAIKTEGAITVALAPG